MVIKAINYKLLEDEGYIIEDIDIDAINTDLKLSNSNYETVTVSRDENGNPFIIIVGQNKWTGLAACGTFNNITVGDVEECIIPGGADVSGASVPEMTDNMIPVIWDGSKWIKADINNAAGTHQWHDYDTRMWANAVTVAETGSGTGTDGITRRNRAAYISAAVGTPISITDILTFFVWIPRYKYAIPSGSGPREISVEFESKTTPKSTGNAIGTNYLTHPAFTFGTDELSGIWVGKFTTTGTIGNITIKPNLTTVRNQIVSAMFTTAREMQSGGNLYGFPATGVNTHMMKNTEWGAVAYISHSRYGKYGDSNYVGLDKEIYLNNSVATITGRSGGARGGSVIFTPDDPYTSQGYYTYDGKCAFIHGNLPAPCNSGSVGQELPDKNLSFGASTTGNIYGIYDITGGAYQYVMGGYNNYSGWSSSYNSGFNGPYIEGGSKTDGIDFPESKYYDRYTVTYPLSTACEGSVCRGHALSETDSWYNDYNDFSDTWLARGADASYMESAGAFGFYSAAGDARSDHSFRIVITSTP